MITYGKFINELSKRYTTNTLCVRWFLQESTFSYEIYHIDNAFLPNKQLFISEVFWHGRDNLQDILDDIDGNLKKIKNGLKLETLSNGK